jgi:hypothetical protein
LDYSNEFTSDEIIKVLDKHLSDDTLWFGYSSTFYWPEQSNDEFETTRTANSYLSEMYYDSDYNEVKKVIDYVRQHSNAKILYGGAKAQFYATFDTDPNIDYYIAGNADNALIDITNYFAGKQDTIQHLLGKLIDSTLYNEPDVNNIPTRWWKKEYNVLPNEGLPIELARGCIFKCKFCSYPLLGKKKGTYLRDPYEIKDELIKTWESHGTESYFFTDDTFNDDNDKLESLYNVFTSLPFKPKFASYLRVDLLNRFPHQIDMLTEMGLVGTFFGLETLQPESAKAIGKGLHPNKVKDCLYRLYDKWKNKVNIEAGFILGLPYDRLSYFNELIDWCLEDDNPIQASRFYPLMMFDYRAYKEMGKYGSTFSLHPEVYGYEFKDTLHEWTLPTQKLSFVWCRDIAKNLNHLVGNKNKIAGFQVITALNTGIELNDIYAMTEDDIIKKYDIPSLNKQKINEYKKLVGLC